jgi:hypothetical protein
VVEEAHPGSSPTPASSDPRPRPIGFWPRPVRRLRGGKKQVRRKVDRMLRELGERIWIELDEKGVTDETWH